jgi:5-methyltetrahydrofolate--homocysteine methyltransferase
MPSAAPPGFTIIGENIHTTRVLLRKSRRVVRAEDGSEAVSFAAADGSPRLLPIPESLHRSQDYQEGRVKHVKLALQAAMNGAGGAAGCGRDYLAFLVRQQEDAGAHFLDVNVDEISIKLADQKAAMDWVVRAVQDMTALPLSIDSSNVEVIAAGLAACRPGRRPMLNSASLERIEALDLARSHGARVIVTAAGERGMPSGVEDRMANAGRMVEAALAKGIAPGDIHVDPLVFPISVDKEFARHSLETMRRLRARFGHEIHITGGLSNISFGIPHRRVINDVFLMMAMDAGADCGIIDPVMNPPGRIADLDRSSVAFRLAENVLMGRDEHCRAFIRAWRKGELDA